MPAFGGATHELKHLTDNKDLLNRIVVVQECDATTAK